MLLTAAMASLLHTCAPRVGARTMAAIVEHESGWKPWSIDDDTARRSYHFTSQAQAVVGEKYLLNLGHNLDVGLAQVNSSNFTEYGLTPDVAFDQCANLRAGAAIIANDYATSFHTNWVRHPIRTQRDLYAQQQLALIHALSAYNSGREWASMGYASIVYRLGLAVVGSIRPARVAPHRPTASFWVYHAPVTP